MRLENNTRENVNEDKITKVEKFIKNIPKSNGQAYKEILSFSRINKRRLYKISYNPEK